MHFKTCFCYTFVPEACYGSPQLRLLRPQLRFFPRALHFERFPRAVPQLFLMLFPSRPQLGFFFRHAFDIGQRIEGMDLWSKFR